MALSALAIAAIGIGVASIGADMYHSSSNWEDPNKEKRKRRGPSDYEPTSFTVGGIPEPLQPLKPLDALGGLVTLQTLQPLVPAQPLSVVPPKRYGYKNPEFNEFTDPLQVNSISDVLFNQEGRDIIMEDLGLDWVDDIPVLGAVAETVIVGADMLYHKTLKPIAQGEFGKAFINGMNGLSEDLDYIDLANTVKGFVLEKDKSKVITRSLGLGHEGKYNYDYDTGNGWKDFGLEVISSPGTWFTLVKGFAASGVKNLAKNSIKETIETVAKTTGVDTMSEAMQTLMKRTSRIAADITLDSKVANELLEEVLKEYVAKSVSKESVEFAQVFMKEFNKNLTTVAGSKIMTALKVVKPLDEVNDAMSAIILKTYLTGGTYPILHKTYDPIITALKNSTINGLSKVTKKGVDTIKAIFPKDETVLDLVKVVDNATIKEITEAQFRTVKLGRAKYGNALDFLKPFGNSEAFDQRLIGIIRSLKDIDLPEDKFLKLLSLLEEDVKAGKVLIDMDLLRNSAVFKEYVIGTATEAGYILKTASALDAVQDALNKNFKYVRRDVLNSLADSKTNLDAFVKLEDYFKSQGITLNEMLEQLDKMIADADIDSLIYVQQKEFLEDLLEELGFDEAWLAKDSDVLKRAISSLTGETTDEVLQSAIKEIDFYKIRGKEILAEADSLFKLQKQMYKLLSEKGFFYKEFHTLLGDTTISQAERNALIEITKALDTKTPLNTLFDIRDVLTGTVLEDTMTFVRLDELVSSVQQQLDSFIPILDYLEPKYITPVSEYARNPFAGIEMQDFTPDGTYKRLKDLNFVMTSLGKEDLETAKYLQKLIDQPNMIKAFDNPIKPNELGKSLDKISFKNAEEFFEDLKRRGVARNIMEDLSPEQLDDVLKTINGVENGLPNHFEKLQENIMTMLYDESVTDEILIAAFKEEGVSNIDDIINAMREVNSYFDRAVVIDNHRTILAQDLFGYMDSIEDLSEKISVAHRIRTGKLDVGEQLGSLWFKQLDDLQTALQESYVPLFERIQLSGDQGRIYRLKLLQLYNRIENINKLREVVYDKQSVLDLIRDIAESKETIVGGLIETIANGNATDIISDDFRQMARQIQNRAQSTVNYLKLQEELYKFTPKFGLNEALLDWLENLNRTMASDINITRETIEQILEERTELGRAAGVMKLENYYNTNVAHKYDDILKAHNAVDDRIMQIRILQDQMDRKLVNIPEGKVFVSFDIETTGLRLKQIAVGDADVVQIAAARYQVINGRIEQVGEAFEAYAKPRRIPTKDIIDLLGEETLAKANDSIKSTHDIVKEFLEYVKNDAVAGQNIIDFDIPYLKEVSNYVEGEVYDTYQIMKATEFKSKLYSNENIEMFKEYVERSYNLLQEYTKAQQEINMPFINTIDKFFADDLYNLFNPLDYQLQRMDKRGLNLLSSGRIEDARSYILGKADSSVDYSKAKGSLPEGTDSAVIKDGTSMIQTLRQGLMDTKSTNAELANWYITTDALQREFGTTNIFAVMHGMQDGRYVDEFLLNKYGVRTMWKPDHINILNNLPENINVANAVQVEKFRNTLDRVYERVYTSYTGYTAEQIGMMKDFILKDFGNSVWLKYTNLDELSMYELWSLYQTLGFYNIENGVRRQAANLELARGLMANTPVSDSLKSSIMYVDDVQKLTKSYDILEDAIYGGHTERQIEDAIADLLNNGDNNDAMRAIAYMERDYTTFVKDAGTFDEDWYARIIRKDFESNYSITSDARKVVSAKTNIRPDVYYQYQRLSRQRHINHTKSVLGLTPESLTKYMHEHGYIAYLKGVDLATFADDIELIKANKKLYEAAGISFKQTDDHFYMYLNKNFEHAYADMTKDVTYKTSYRGVVDKSNLDESMLNYMEAFEKNDLRVRELHDSPFDAYNSTYTTIDASKHGKLTMDLDLPDIVSQAYKEDFYTRVSQINFPALGSVETLRSIDPYVVTDMTNSQIRELNRSLKLSGARNKYIQFLFSDDYTLNRNALWNAMSDEQILDTLKGSKKLSAVVLYEKDGKIMARKINPTSIHHVETIRNLNGSIFPTDIANKITSTINEFDKVLKEKHPYLAKWREYVVSTYKTLYLSSLGFLFRNELDIITKNTATLGEGPLKIPSVLGYNMKAWKMWSEYSEIIAKIITEEDGLTEYAINAFFKNNPQLSRETFEFVHRYAMSSASAGMAKAQQDLVKSFNLNKNSISSNVFKKAVHDNYIVQSLMDVNSHIEHAGRLGLLVQSIDEGKVFDEVIQDVIRTHFDYSNLSYAELLVEHIIPFVTFPIRNLEYWNDALKGNMWLVELMLDATMQTTQVHNQTQFMIDNSTALQNDLTDGNLRLFGSVIKTGSSAFDAARLLLTPADMVADYTEADINRRIVAPLRIPRDKDMYGDVNDFDTKTREYLRNVLAIYQIERPLQVINNLASLTGMELGYDKDDKYNHFFQIEKGNVDNAADVIPSIVGERNIKPGNMSGDMRIYQKLPNGMTLQSIVGAAYRQDAGIEKLLATKVMPPKHKPTTRAAYSKQRIPYTKRYYSSSSNFYNRWKVQSAMRKNAVRNLPPTPESLQHTIRNVFFSNNLTPLKMNYLQYKQRSQLR